MVDAYHRLATLGYPILDAVRGRRVAQRLQELRLNERLTESRVAALQAERLARVVAHAVRTSPYYSERIPPRAVAGGTVDLQAIPILTKYEIQEHGDAIRSRAFRVDDLTPGRSGGSTGTPTRFFHDSNALDYLRASTLRCLAWAGYRVGDKVVKVSGSHFDYGLAKKLQVRVASRLLRQRWLSAVDLHEGRIDCELDELRRWKPDFFWGYASAINRIAEHLIRTGARMRLKGVISSSDNLTDTMRATIAEAFECAVFNAYTTRELSVGWECERHSGFHITSDISYVEVVDDAGRPVGPGTEGRIVVTDLVNFGFPFIRYDLGDRGRMGAAACPCGRPFPILISLDGRSDDFVILTDGTRVAAPAFTVLMSDLASLVDYRFSQEATGRVTVELVNRGPLSAEDARHLDRGLDRLLRATPRRVVQVDAIDYGESGKRRVVTSEVRRSPTGSDQARSGSRDP